MICSLGWEPFLGEAEEKRKLCGHDLKAVIDTTPAMGPSSRCSTKRARCANSQVLSSSALAVAFLKRSKPVRGRDCSVIWESRHHLDKISCQTRDSNSGGFIVVFVSAILCAVADERPLSCCIRSTKYRKPRCLRTHLAEA